MARPRKINKEILRKLEDAFKIGANDREACLHAKIAPSTLYEYQQQHPEFTEQKEDWKRNPILKAKNTIYKNLDDPSVAKWLLERKDEEYSTKLKQEITNLTPNIVVATQEDAELIKEIQNVKADENIL